jgi:Ca2+-transporting ATPase
MFILLAIFIEIPFFFFLFYHELADIAQARTEMFFLFILIELIIALNFRSMKYSIFKVRPHKWLLMALAWEIILITVLIQIPAVRSAFGILKPSAIGIELILGFGIVVFISMEVIKAVIRARKAQRVA